MSEDAEVIKVVLVGEAGVGKTCIIQRFCENKFTPNTISTNLSSERCSNFKGRRLHF